MTKALSFVQILVYIELKFKAGMKKYGYMMIILGAISFALLIPQLSKLITSWVAFSDVLNGNLYGLEGTKAKLVFTVWMYLIGMVVLLWSQGYKYLQSERVR